MATVSEPDRARGSSWVMADGDGGDELMMRASVLDREMYTEAQASRLLGVAQSTLHYWLEGGERRGKSYRPIIRVPYSLADRRPYVSGHQLVCKAQTEAGLDPDCCLVAVANNQLILTPHRPGLNRLH